MKLIILLIIATVLVSGCSAPQYNNSITNETVEQNHKNNILSSTSGPFATLSGVEAEINRIYAGGKLVGDQHYATLNERLDYFKSRGEDKIKIAGLKIKLDSILAKSGGTQTTQQDHNQNSFDVLENEIDEIVKSGKLIGLDHYKRILADLDFLEYQGSDKTKIDNLRQKLETLSPEHYETTDQATIDSGGQNEDNILAQLPDCSGQKYTVFPVDLGEVYDISPLGNLGPPGHTTPTEHMYIHLHAQKSSSQIYDLKAPGEIYIYEISSDPDDIDPSRTEYVIRFGLCKDVHGYFDHVKEISDDLKNTIESTPCQTFSEGSHDACTKHFVKKVDAGEVIGGVGHLQGNFDFGTLDYRAKNDFVNPSRYGDPQQTGLYRPRSLYVKCPLDYYNEPAKSQLFSKVGGSNDPKCGKVMQDVAGTLQGNWFNGDAKIYSSWEKHLAFVYDNYDPSKAVISVGGTFTDASKWVFTPTTGTTNRKFDQVIPDGTVYCYTGEGKSSRIVVQMISETELKIERQDGTCSSNIQFNNPTTYTR